MPITDGSWTAHDVWAHLVTVGRRYLNPRTRLAETLRDTAAINAEELTEVRPLSQAALAEELAANHARYQRACAAGALRLLDSCTAP